MFRELTLSACAFALVAVAAPAFAAQHPVSGPAAAELPPEYGTAAYGLPSSWTSGDLTFGGPYPRAVELTAPERHMLAGPAPAAGETLAGWIAATSEFCLDYYNYFGVLPARLDAEAVAALRQVQGTQPTPPDGWLTLSPLTGAPPRLDAAEFSAGDLYVRPLTNAELRDFAARRPELNDNWFRGFQTDPATGRTGEVKLLSAVLYVRAWGAQGVLFEDLAYRLSEPVYDEPQRIAAPTPPDTGRETDDRALDDSCVTSS